MMDSALITREGWYANKYKKQIPVGKVRTFDILPCIGKILSLLSFENDGFGIK